MNRNLLFIIPFLLSMAAMAQQIDVKAKKNSAVIDSIHISIDSISSPSEVRILGLKQEFDSSKVKIESSFKKVSSLSIVNPLQSQMDSVHSGIDSLTTQLKKNISKAETKVADLEDKVNAKIDKVESSIENGLNPLTKEGVSISEGINIPDVNVDSKSILASENLKLPTDSFKEISTGTQADGLNAQINDALPLSEDYIGFEKFEGVAEKLGQLSKVQDEVSGVTSDIKEGMASASSLPETFENRVSNLAEVKQLQEQVNGFDPMLNQDWQDPDMVKELALKKAKQQAINHFAGHEKQLQTVLASMSEKKAKLKGAEVTVDLLKKRQTNPMKNRTFSQRLVPGLTLQVQNQNNLFVDFNPTIGYLFSGRLSAGLGWNERLSMNTKNRTFQNQDRIFGPRSWITFKLKEGLSVMGSVELMNSISLASLNASGNEKEFKWVKGFFAGIKRDFKFSPSLFGQVHVLYNLYNPDKISPYINRLNIRFGIEFPWNKKRNSK
jgi:hypothetical protein